MPIKALGRCTAKEKPKEQSVSGKKEGPDKDWVLLTDPQVQTFCSGQGKTLEHRGKKDYDHVCASYGEWAFDAKDGSKIRCVVFLHYKVPEKANKFFGDADEKSPAKIFKLTGAKLLSAYQLAKHATGEAHIWQRDSHGEIAIDFCLK